MTMLMKIKLNNKNWPYTPDHPYRILIKEAQDPEKQMYY